MGGLDFGVAVADQNYSWESAERDVIIGDSHGWKMQQSPRDNIFKTHCGCFYHFLFILMQSLKLIPSPRNELTDSVASVQFKDDRLSVGMWSPKSSLQLKLKQALSKSAKISETD